MSYKVYEELKDHMKKVALYDTILSLLDWDEKVMMPAKAAEYRSDQLSLLAGLQHEQLTDPKIPDLLEKAEEETKSLDPESPEKTNIREWKRLFDRASKLPTSLVQEKSKIQSAAHQAWLQARKENTFTTLQPNLEKMFAISRQIADCYGYESNPYDALIEEYEQGITCAEVLSIFSDFKEKLVPLVQRVADSNNKPDISFLQRNYPFELQILFVKDVVSRFGYDFERGRLDGTEHPFCTTLGPNDTRITTRRSAENFGSNFYSVLHEAGHGMYEQNLDTEHFGTPRGTYTSLGIHESQSRMWENLVGRSSTFWEYWYPKAKQTFNALEDVNQVDFYRAVNAFAPSLIRTEADELTYNIHVFIRTEIEIALLNDDLKVSDIPEIWNQKYKEYLGVDVPDDLNGCLQDIHWSYGLIGYFPTYTLGNLYAAQLFAKAEKDLGGNLLSLFSEGKFTPLLHWLRKNVHLHGQTYLARDLIKKATGEPLNPSYLVNYLTKKVDTIYG